MFIQFGYDTNARKQNNDNKLYPNSCRLSIFNAEKPRHVKTDDFILLFFLELFKKEVK